MQTMFNNTTDPMDINIKNIASLFDDMDNEWIDFLVREHTGYISQKDLSKVFGVRESTFNGWVNSNKYPDYAKIIFGLFIAFENLKTTHLELTKKTNMTLPVDMGGEYGLIELDKDNKGNFQAKIVARGITNRTEAEKLVTSINTANIFANYIPTLFDTFDGGGPSGIHFDDEEFPNRIEPYDKPLMEMLHKGIEQLHSQGLSKSFIKTININHFPSGKSTNQAALNMLREHLTEAELGELEPLMNKGEA